MTGSIVAFLDPDDKCLPNFIQLMLSAMLRYDADLVMCRNTVHRTEGRMSISGTEKVSPSIASGHYDRKCILQGRAEGIVNPNVWNKIYKSVLWKKIRFPEGRVYEDIATIFQVLNVSDKVYVLDDILYLRRIRLGSITSKPSLKTRLDFVWALSQFESFIEANSPDVFNKKHLERVSSMKQEQIIHCFVQSCIEKEYPIQRTLRNQFFELKSKGIICPLRYKMVCCLIIYCPWLLKALGPFFRCVT